jgi:site-specific recombinase XerD
MHDIRHSTASALISSGSTLAEVGLVLGHSSLQATARYAHLYPEKQATILDRLWAKKRA